MRKIELFTADQQYVSTVEVPPFPDGHMPGVVIWGSRVFTRATDGTYTEAFAVMSLTPSPGLDREPQKIVEEKAGTIINPKAVAKLEFYDAPPVDRSAVTSLHGTPVEEIREQHAKEPTGMHADYIVLSDEERAKGFVRPVRQSYQHVGLPAPKYSLRDLTAEEHERYYSSCKYVKYEEYPKDHESGSVGRFWTQEQLDKVGKGCGTVTKMGLALSETYARDPHFYGATFCVGCDRHLPVGEFGEFIWDKTDIRVGT
jgi:hypothetical protein